MTQAGRFHFWEQGRFKVAHCDIVVRQRDVNKQRIFHRKTVMLYCILHKKLQHGRGKVSFAFFQFEADVRDDPSDVAHLHQIQVWFKELYLISDGNQIPVQIGDDVPVHFRQVTQELAASLVSSSINSSRLLKLLNMKCGLICSFSELSCDCKAISFSFISAISRACFSSAAALMYDWRKNVLA